MIGESENNRTETLGLYLAGLRAKEKMSLRDVEEATSKNVSNAYLSQLEHGKITKPSPAILHSLAEVYKIPYEGLMRRAGYLPSTNRADDATHGRAATFAVDNLTQDEEKELLQYLTFLRKKKKDE